MRFTPKTEEQLQEENLIPQGTYDFEVVEAKDRVSKSGNDMIELKLCVYDQNGSPRTVFDYLLESMSYKLKHFCDAVGLAHKYTDGTLADHDCMGKAGKVMIIQQPPQNGYAAKNSVRDYIVMDDKNSEKTAAKTSDEKTELNDDLPF